MALFDTQYQDLKDYLDGLQELDDILPAQIAAAVTMLNTLYNTFVDERGDIERSALIAKEQEVLSILQRIAWFLNGNQPTTLTVDVYAELNDLDIGDEEFVVYAKGELAKFDGGQSFFISIPSASGGTANNETTFASNDNKLFRRMDTPNPIVVDDTRWIDSIDVGGATALQLRSKDTASAMQSVFETILNVIDSSSGSYDAEADIKILGTKIMSLAADHVSVTDGYMEVDKVSAPSTPAAGKGRVYMKTGASKIFFKNEAGTEYDLTGGIGSGIAHGININNPTASEDEHIFFTNQAITIQEMRAVVAGTSPSVTWTVRFDAKRNSSGTEVVTGGTTTTSESDGSSVTSFNDATIPANQWVWVKTTAVSGTVSKYELSVIYTVD